LRGAKRRGNLVDFPTVMRLPRGVYPEPVEGLAMTNRHFSNFLRVHQKQLFYKKKKKAGCPST
jgi:hypothetical protein